MDLKQLFYRAMEVGYREGWHRKVAKYAEAPGSARWQPLLYHAINAALIAWETAPLFNAQGHRPALFAGAFLHDYTKHRREFQELPSGRGSMPPKTPSEEERRHMEEIIRALGLEGEEARLALRIALLNETPGAPQDPVRQLREGPLPKNLLDAAVLADVLTSLKGYWDLSGRPAEILRRYGYHLAYHRVSQIRGVVTQLVHRAVASLMEGKGYRPILYLADGVVYVGRGEAFISREELRRAIVDSIKGFLDRIPPRRLGEASFGNIVQTVIRAPEFLRASGKAVEGLWLHVASQNFVRKPKMSDRLRAVLEERGVTGVEAEDLGAKIVSAKNLFIVYKEILKETGGDGADKRADEKLAKTLGVKPEEIGALRVIGNTTKAEKLVDLLLPFLRKTGLIDLTPGEAAEKLLNAMMDATRGLGGGASVFEEEAGLLLGEVSLWGDRVSTDLAPEPPRPAYEKGKEGIAPVCFLCGAPITKAAVASLVGSGAEAFHNLRAGGEPTGGERKARICPVCRLEASLRSLLGFNPDRDDVYYVLPAIVMSPAYSSYYWSRLAVALQAGDRLALHSPDFWKRYLGGLSPVDVARNPLLLHAAAEGVGEAQVKALAEKLRDRYEPEDLEEMGLPADYEEAARAVARGDVPPEAAEELASLVKGEDYAAAMYSGNYMVVAAKAPGFRDEAEASKMLRRLNRALMIHRLFHAFVLVPDEKMTPFPEPRPLGAAKAPLKADLASMLRERGVALREGWVDFRDEGGVKLPAEELSMALTAAELVEYEMRRAKIGYGRSGLLEVLSRPPGMLLARYVNVRGPRGLRVFLGYLNELEKRWWV